MEKFSTYNLSTIGACRLPNPLSSRISSTTVTVLYILAFVLFVQFLAGALLHKYDVYSAFPFSALGMYFNQAV